jgi:hypothetical protein
MRVFRTSAALGAAAVAGLMFGAVAPAVAEPANSTSQGFAGYSLTQTTAITSASTAFTLPSLACPATGSFGILAVAELANSNSHTAAVGGALIACINGSASYRPFVFINGVQTTPGLTLAAGDKLTVAVNQDKTTASVIITDLTHPATRTLSGSGGRDREASIGDFAVAIGGQPSGIPPFGRIIFSHDDINGVALGSLNPTAIDMVAPGGTVQITTSTLTHGGNSFRTTFKHS